MSKLSQEEVISKFKLIHNDKYDYSTVYYNGMNNHILIKCNVADHPPFKITPVKHLAGQGCPICGNKLNADNRIIKYKSSFLEKANKKYNNFYNYDKSILVNSGTKIIITCPVHGEFLQTPILHLSTKHGCELCADVQTGKQLSYTSVDFIEKAKLVYGDKYDYSKVEYKGSKEKVCIICPEHGEFLQKPDNHINGSSCPICNSYSKGELLIKKILTDKNIQFIPQKWFNDLRSLKGRPLKFDFFIPSHNLIIEYNGEQHYKPIKYFGGIESLINIQNSDALKINYLKEHNINLLIIKYNEYKNVQNILEIALCLT